MEGSYRLAAFDNRHNHPIIAAKANSELKSFLATIPEGLASHRLSA
jgi:hypothetical protein